MSAIAGIYFLDGRPVDREVLERMVESMAHRGPDGLGGWWEGSVGLGHRMLWTTPESLKERQPMLSEEGSLCLTADARVDNREELKAELAARGVRLRTDTDAELILRAYEVWGEDCPRKILGDFAFALWDGRRRRLFCARDPIGIKPFYYYFDGKTFSWASEPRAIFEDRTIPREPNLPLICLYLLGRFDEREETLYRGVCRLPPAHFMVLEGGHLWKAQYWDLDPGHTIRYQTDTEYAEHFLHLFREAVRAQLRSHGPVGALLSGGLDSSSVVCVARQLLAENGGSQPRTFSFVYDDVPECDERPYIESVLAQGGLSPCYVHADRISPLADLDRASWHQDEALYGPNHYLVWALFSAAWQLGVRIVLDGFDGDTTVSHGMVRVAELTRTGRWLTLIREVTGLSRHQNVSFWRVLSRRAIRPVLPQPAREVWRALRSRNTPPWSVDTAINGAERALRPAVIVRKLSAGNRSQRGAKTPVILASVIQTCCQTGQDFLAQA